MITLPWQTFLYVLMNSCAFNSALVFLPVRLPGRYTEEDGAVRVHDHGGDRPQAAVRYDAARH